MTFSRYPFKQLHIYESLLRYIHIDRISYQLLVSININVAPCVLVKPEDANAFHACASIFFFSGTEFSKVRSCQKYGKWNIGLREIFWYGHN
jgi:hypothetical protein